jgi:hypothetical protein
MLWEFMQSLGISREDLLQMLIHEPEYLLTVRTACDPRKMEEWYLLFVLPFFPVHWIRVFFIPSVLTYSVFILKEENNG